MRRPENLVYFSFLLLVRASESREERQPGRLGNVSRFIQELDKFICSLVNGHQNIVFVSFQKFLWIIDYKLYYYKEYYFYPVDLHI